MNRVMVDNWFLGEVVRHLRTPKEVSGKAYGELLMALVLWDEICFPLNGRSRSWAETGELLGCLTPIEDDSEGFERSSMDLLMLFAYEDGFRDPYYNWMSDPENIVNASALRYLMFSAKHGCDYLPCARRQTFLEAHRDQKYMKELLTRMKLMGTLDEAAEAYYKESYQALLEISELKLPMPVLADFILDSTPAGMRPVEHALHLRQEGAVIRYRSFLSQLEEALENQNWKELRQLLAASREAVQSVIDLDKKRLKSVTVKLLPTPSVVVNAGRWKGEVSANPSLSFDAASGRRMQLSFLRDLTRYAINERKLWEPKPENDGGGIR